VQIINVRSNLLTSNKIFMVYIDCFFLITLYVSLCLGHFYDPVEVYRRQKEDDADKSEAVYLEHLLSLY